MKIDLKTINEVVCKVFEVDDFKIKSRKRPIVDARKAYSYLSRKYTPDTYERIGLFINQQHDTIIYHEKSFLELMKSTPDLRIKRNVCEFLLDEIENKDSVNLV